MPELNVICPVCKTQNSSDYSFCSNCGTPLTISASHGTPNDSIAGIPIAEVADYIGKGNDKYIPKFIKHSTGSKAGFNWPIFLFSILLNIPFVWFFYRKMYKVGAMVLAVSLAISITTSICLTYMANVVMEPMLNAMQQTLTIDPNADPEVFEQKVNEMQAEIMTEVMQNEDLAVYSSIFSLLDYAKLALALVCSIFGTYWYYKKAMKDLAKLNVNGPPIADIVVATGGTNTAAGVLTGVFINFLQNMIVIIPFVSIIVTGVLEFFASQGLL